MLPVSNVSRRGGTDASWSIRPVSVAIPVRDLR
jgi:hypothetical protein